MATLAEPLVHGKPGAEENWTVSVQHSEADVRRYLDNFREFARDLTHA